MSPPEQTNWGALAEKQGILKSTELLLMETDFVRLQIMRNFKVILLEISFIEEMRTT